MTSAQRPSQHAAVFLDRDGTVSRYTEYCRHPEDLHLLPRAGEAIKRLNDAGLAVVIVTNQSAVGRGWLSLDGLAAIHDKMRRDLEACGARVDAIYACPHHPDDGCRCRKPGRGLFDQAARELGIALADSYMIGDRMLDVLAGRTASITTILVKTGHPAEPVGARADYEAADLLDAAEWILQREAAGAARAASREASVRS